MKTLVEQIQTLDELIRAMHKINSFCMNGQVIQANRECLRVLADLERNKTEIIQHKDDNND